LIVRRTDDRRWLRLNLPAGALRKERGDAPKIVLLPVRKRMVMALGAIQTHTEEHPDVCAGQVLRRWPDGHLKYPCRSIGIGRHWRRHGNADHRLLG
jgi:hypothetical protein